MKLADRWREANNHLSIAIVPWIPRSSLTPSHHCKCLRSSIENLLPSSHRLTNSLRWGMMESIHCTNISLSSMEVYSWGCFVTGQLATAERGLCAVQIYRKHFLLTTVLQSLHSLVQVNDLAVLIIIILNQIFWYAYVVADYLRNQIIMLIEN